MKNKGGNMQIGIIGLGYWGKNLLRNLNDLGVLTVMCDKDMELLTQRKKDYPHIYDTGSAEDVYSQDIDGVVIATPPCTHYELAKQALSNDKHVFVEKPLTLDYLEAEELVELAEEKRLILMVGMVFLYNPIVNKIKEIIDTGRIGQIKYIQLRRINFGILRDDVDAWWNLAPHDISIIQHWTNDNIKSIRSSGTNIIKEDKSDIIHSVLETSNGIKAYIESSWMSPLKERDGFIVGTKGMIVYNDVKKPYIEVNSNEAINNKAVKGHVFYPEVPEDEPLRKECLEFINSIKERRDPLTNGKENLDIMATLEAGEISMIENINVQIL